MIIRGLAGVLIGAAYGVLVGVLVFLLTRIGLEREQHSSLIMLDPVTLAWLGTIFAGLVTGVCGMLVGLIVALWGVNKTKAVIIGLGVGLLTIALFFLAFLTMPQSFKDLIELFVVVMVLPVGLALMGMLVSVVTVRLGRPTGSR